MWQSMTGFGVVQERYTREGLEMELSLELRSLNSKYLDIHLRTPKVYASLESRISKKIKSRFRRGRIDLSCFRRVHQGQTQDYVVNFSQAESLAMALKKVATQLNLEGGVSVRDLLQSPDWLQVKDSEAELEDEWKFVEALLDRAMDQVEKSRLEEGAGLEKIFSRHRNELKSGFAAIQAQQKNLGSALKRKWTERLQDLAGEIALDPTRVEQEVVYLLSRTDFTEETDRLAHHLTQLDSFLKLEGERGRRLEFLVQEMHRELNTMGSKCPDASVTTQIMELKGIVDRMKEQAANVE